VATPYAELHCHSNFSFLDGASSAEDLAERAVSLGLSAVAVTDHSGLYGAVRFAIAMDEAGVKPIIGLEIELLDAAAPDPRGIVVPARRVLSGGRRSALGERRFAPNRLALPGRPPATRLPEGATFDSEPLRGAAGGGARMHQQVRIGGVRVLYRRPAAPADR
jgi:hypothetical protein